MIICGRENRKGKQYLRQITITFKSCLFYLLYILTKIKISANTKSCLDNGADLLPELFDKYLTFVVRYPNIKPFLKQKSTVINAAELPAFNFYL